MPTAKLLRSPPAYKQTRTDIIKTPRGRALGNRPTAVDAVATPSLHPRPEEFGLDIGPKSSDYGPLPLSVRRVSAPHHDRHPHRRRACNRHTDTDTCAAPKSQLPVLCARTSCEDTTRVPLRELPYSFCFFFFLMHHVRLCWRTPARDVRRGAVPVRCRLPHPHSPPHPTASLQG